jgi:putative tryptophan/tyrosine transport system substrate-binding protein
MKRREFIAALGGAVAWPLCGDAQPPPPLPAIGFLATGSAEVESFRVTAFRSGLSEMKQVTSKVRM